MADKRKDTVPMISTEALSVGYGGIPLIRDIALSAGKGEIMSVCDVCVVFFFILSKYPFWDKHRRNQ